VPEGRKGRKGKNEIKRGPDFPFLPILPSGKFSLVSNVGNIPQNYPKIRGVLELTTPCEHQFERKP
jgi:hypothetical protein